MNNDSTYSKISRAPDHAIRRAATTVFEEHSACKQHQFHMSCNNQTLSTNQCLMPKEQTHPHVTLPMIERTVHKLGT